MPALTEPHLVGDVEVTIAISAASGRRMAWRWSAPDGTFGTGTSGSIAAARRAAIDDAEERLASAE